MPKKKNKAVNDVKEEIIIRTDSILKEHILGSIEGSYVQIDNRLPLVEDNGIYRGLWILKNGFMGGPFLIKTCLIEEKIVVSVGVIFAPQSEKRNYVKQLEAIL